ncbi:hypothetical protein E2C01_062787 [Portunus trituberculatus]|uniref:Uncharacterized protein n=1 Tax=Portunus trituberculatus TaxID=210409 RepID=A0A5B7HGD2_PORTR|nr:hypothetical protein [Portunus trituberculatus]
MTHFSPGICFKNSTRREAISTSDIKTEPENEWFSDSTDSADEPHTKICRWEPESSDHSWGFLPIPGKFLQLDQIIDILKSTDKVLESVPRGEKNNVFFILEDSKNALRKRMNMRTDYHDDCGVWDSQKGKTANTYITFCDGSFKTVSLKDGLLCSESRKKGVSHWIPLDPQPDWNTVVKVHRYYTTLKGNDSYKRRITSVSGGEFSDRVVVEYAGIRTGPITVHGNSKSAREYMRTNPRLLERMNEEIKNKSPKQVYEEMLQDSELGVPRSLKQVADVKYRASRREHQKEVVKVADENLDFLTMLEENPSVQAVIHRKDLPSCVILHSGDQLGEMKRNLENESVIGVDCTYKVGDCYITMTVYRNSRDLHEETLEPLLYLGPVLLHWDVELKTYVSFFSYLMSVLGDMEPTFEVKLGDEIELAVLDALENCFPSSVLIMNCQCLEENVNRKLSLILGDRPEECSMILMKMFSAEGIASSPTMLDFEDRVSNLRSYFEKFPDFKSYFDELQPLLYSYVCEPQQRGVSQKLWTKSNDEILSGLLKSTVRQKHHKLPDLVEKICSVSRLQMLDVESVM